MFSKSQPILNRLESSVSLETSTPPSESKKKVEEKNEKLCSIRLYCLSKKIPNYIEETKDVRMHYHTTRRTRYSVKSTITTDELFNSFPKNKTITVYKRLRRAFAASNSSILSGDTKLNSHEYFWGRHGVYADAYAVFAIDVEVKLSDYATQDYFNIKKEQIKKISHGYIDGKIVYKSKAMNEYLSSFKSFYILEPELILQKGIQASLTLLQTYQRSLFKFFNSSLINKIDILMEKIRSAKTMETLFYLCFEEKQQLKESTYKNILSVICDRLLLEDETLEKTVINKLSGLQDSASVIEDRYSLLEMNRWRAF